MEFIIDSTQLTAAGIDYMRRTAVQALADCLYNPAAGVHTEVLNWGYVGYRVRVKINGDTA